MMFYNGWDVEANDEIENDGNDVNWPKIESLVNIQWKKEKMSIVTLSLLITVHIYTVETDRYDLIY